MSEFNNPEIATPHSFHNYEPSMPPLRAQVDRAYLGIAQTDAGEFPLYEIDMPGLDDNSRNALEEKAVELTKSRKRRSKKLGGRARDIIIGSPAAVLAAERDGSADMLRQSGITFAYPAIIQRDAATSNITGANGVDRPYAQGHPINFDFNALARYREGVVNSMLSQQWPIVNRSPDTQLHRPGESPLRTGSSIQPHFSRQSLGTLPDGTPVDRAWLKRGSFPEHPNSGELTLIHSRSAFTLPIDSTPSEYAQTVIAHTANPETLRQSRDYETQQQLQVFDSFGILSIGALTAFTKRYS